MEVSGEIIKKNEELGYGFVSVKGSEDIFFSPDTEYNYTHFSTLKIGDKVKIQIKVTDRGLFATSLAPTSSIQKSPGTEASI